MISPEPFGKLQLKKAPLKDTTLNLTILHDLFIFNGTRMFIVHAEALYIEGKQLESQPS